MPELPDITVYVERLAVRAAGQVLRKLQLLDPFVLRTALPPIGNAEGLHQISSQGMHRFGAQSPHVAWRVVSGQGGEVHTANSTQQPRSLPFLFHRSTPRQ